VSVPARLRRLLTPPRLSRAWPASITLLALIVFVMFWAQITLMVALIAALATLLAGSALLTLMCGTGRTARAHHTADPQQDR
jgi:hypothetical protein